MLAVLALTAASSAPSSAVHDPNLAADQLDAGALSPEPTFDRVSALGIGGQEYLPSPTPTSAPTSTPTVAVTPSPRPTAKPGAHGWLWPVPGHPGVTLGYGCTGYYAEPRYGSCRHFHDAIDIGAPKGTPVVASTSGTVIWAGWRPAGSAGSGGGIVVWIRDRGTTYTTYNHLSAVKVKRGQHVGAGQVIGKVGATGNANGPHLHFEVWACYPWTGGSFGCARSPWHYLG